MVSKYKLRSKKSSNNLPIFSSPLSVIDHLKYYLINCKDFFKKKILTFKIFHEPECFPFVSYSLLLFELILNLIIINKVPCMIFLCFYYY